MSDAQPAGGLPPGVVLLKHQKINLSDGSHTGPLTADERGLGVDVKRTTSRSLVKVQYRITRHYICEWKDVTDITVEPAAPHVFGGSTVNRNTVVVSVTATTNQHSFVLHGMTVPQVRNVLGPYIAKVAANTKTSTSPTALPDLSEQLTKLVALRDQGALTAEEFETAKRGC